MTPDPDTPGMTAAPRRERRDWTQVLLVLPNTVWLLLFMVGALFFLFLMSLRGYEPGGRGMLDTWELSNYWAFISDPFYLKILGRSLLMALWVTIGCLILGFPLAYALSRLRGMKRALLYFAVLVPLLTSAVIRTFGWMILLSNKGFVNQTLMSIGLIDSPIPMMYRMTGIIIALIQVLLPFMVLALDAALLNIDRQIYDAARNLGAGRVRIFFRVTLPLALPGIVSGSILVFTLAISAFVTPALVGGPRIPVMATLIYQQGIALLNWPLGAAISLVMLVVLVVILSALMSIASRAMRRAS
ncbi:ABC transporter permease [Acuticoccus sp. M5D2P5]|uniref:ABC transporter permease n=1 Tax=Acuticoccus kalidii TaxID=2910977 RepID=UPI001F3C65BE|nr:ABC transporter permease [Acuticoccus kalidii]MCF3935701.1 ABC transporter permease [Acuticoccus kalidii]